MTSLTEQLSEVKHSLPALLSYRSVMSTRLHMVTLLSFVFGFRLRPSASQQFHHLSWRNCYSFKSNFNQSSPNLWKRLIFFRLTTDCVYDRKYFVVFAAELHTALKKKKNKAPCKNGKIHIKAFSSSENVLSFSSICETLIYANVFFLLFPGEWSTASFFFSSR